jgi:hypothetical protein
MESAGFPPFIESLVVLIACSVASCSAVYDGRLIAPAILWGTEMPSRVFFSSLCGFGHWLKGQIIAEVPMELALCEFDCRRNQCPWGEWLSCERRISKAAGELMPSVFRQQGTGVQDDLACLPFHPETGLPFHPERSLDSSNET